MHVYGADYSGYQADGGNFMSCVGNGTKLSGGADADKISCEGNDCAVFGGAGNDDIAVVNPYGPGVEIPGTDIYTSVIRVRFRVHRRTRISLSCFSAGRPRH